MKTPPYADCVADETVVLIIRTSWKDSGLSEPHANMPGPEFIPFPKLHTMVIMHAHYIPFLHYLPQNYVPKLQNLSVRCSAQISGRSAVLMLTHLLSTIPYMRTLHITLFGPSHSSDDAWLPTLRSLAAEVEDLRSQ